MTVADQGLYPSLLTPFPIDAKYADYANRVVDAYRPQPQAPVAPVAPPPPQQGLLTDIGHGFARGALVTTPELFGKAVQAFGGDETGKAIAAAAAARGNNEAFRVNPGGWGEAASMVVPALGAAATAFIPGIGEVAAPTAAAALFGGSQYTETRERGGSVGQALGTGAIQGIGQALAGHVGGKVLTGAGNMFRAPTAQGVLDSFVNPSVLGTTAKNLAKAAAIQVPTQAAAAGGVAAIEHDLPNTPSGWEAAKASVAPTLMMTALTGPFAAAGTLLNNRARARIANAATQVPDPAQMTPDQIESVRQERTEASMVLWREMSRVDPASANSWLQNVLQAVNADAPIALDANFKYDPAQPAPAVPPAAPPLALPAPGQVPVPMGGPDASTNPIGAVQDAAAQSAVDRNNALHAARLAEEQRLEPLRNPYPTSQGIDVQEGGPAESINVLPPERYQDETINIHPPLQSEGAGGLKGGRGSQPTPDEVASLLKAAKAEGGPSQGTARLLGLLHESPLIIPTPSGGVTYSINRQQRVQMLRDVLGSRATGAINQLAGLQPHELANEVRMMWLQKGGENAKAEYVAKLGDLYKQLTGREVNESTTAQSGQRNTLTLQPSTKETVERASDITADATRQPPSPQVTDSSRRQDSLLEPPRTVEQINDDNRRIITGVEGLQGEPKYQALRENAKAAKAIEAVKETPREGQPEYQGAEPQPTTVPPGTENAGARDQTAEAAGRTEPGSNAGKDAAEGRVSPQQQFANSFAAPEGAQNALSSRQEQSSGGVQYQDRNAGGTPAATGGSNLNVANAQRNGDGKGNAQARKEALAFSKAVAERRDATTELRAWDKAHSAELGGSRRELSQLNNEINQNAGLEPTAEQFARKNALQTHIGHLLAERDVLQQHHSDAVGEVERRTSGPEPTKDRNWYEFDRKPLDPTQGAVGQNFVNTAKYAFARAFTKQVDKTSEAGKAITKLLSLGARKGSDESLNMGDFRPPQASRRSAADALASLTPEQHKAYEDRIVHLVRSIDMMKLMHSRGNEAESHLRHVREQYFSVEMPFEQKNEQIDADLAAGKITSQEAAQLRTANVNEAERAQAKLDSMDRGIAGLSDGKLYGAIKNTLTAQAAMDHLGREHSNPLVRTVAKLLGSYAPKTTIEVVPEADFNGGRYHPATDTIQIGRGGMNAVTLMHETTHALAHAAIYRALGNMGHAYSDMHPQAREEVKAVVEIQRIMRDFRNAIEQTKRDDPAFEKALESEHEFLSEALNNPTLQEALGGRSSMFQRFTDAVRRLVGLDEKHTTDFDRLLRAAPTLFGDPNRNITHVLRRDLVESGPFDSARSPRDALAMSQLGTQRLSGVSGKLSSWFSERNASATVKAEGLKWLTLNHSTQMLQSIMDRAKASNPALGAHLDPLLTAFKSFRMAISDRAGATQYLNTEANVVQKKLLRMQQEQPALYDRMHTMGVEASRLRVDPAAKTLQDAQKRNPNLTAEVFDAPEARALRNEYQRLAVESERLKRSGAVDTPISVYHEALLHNDLMFTRHYAAKLENIIREFGAHMVPEMEPIYNALNWTNHRRDANYRETPAQRQQELLQGAMGQARKVIDDIAKQEMQAGPQSKGALDAMSMKSLVDDLGQEYSRQRAVPYLHIGRSGDYMVMFTVADAPGAWDRVGELVGRGRTGGGLERGWGVPYDGNRRVYMRFDNEGMYLDAVKKLRPFLDEGLFKDGEGNSSWASGPITDKLQALDAATPQFVRGLRDKILANDEYDTTTKDRLVRDLTDSWLQQLPETSPLKASIYRDGLVGYSKEFTKTYAERMLMANNALVRTRTSPQISRSIAGVDRGMKGLREDVTPGAEQLKLDVGRYMNELRERVDQMSQPVSSPIIDALRGMTATWRLALSPAYLMMTMYQPWQVTLPMLGAKHGFTNAARSMSRNAALSFAILNKTLSMGWATEKGADTFSKLSNLSDLKLQFADMKNKDGSPLLTQQQLDVLDHLQWSGLLSFGQTNQIARMDATDMSGIAKASRIASVFPHYAEVSNRMIAMLAAHELALSKGMTNDKAKEYALQIVRDSDGDHSQANIARRLGRRGVFGAATPLAVGFQQYDIQMTELLARTFLTASTGSKAERIEAAKSLAGMASMTGVIAGALGLPFMGLATAIANVLGDLIGDANATPTDMQNSFRSFAAGVFGEKGGEIVSRGLPRALDFDMSGRSGLQDIAPFTNFLEDRRALDDRIKDGMFTFAGPFVGAVAGIATGAYAAAHGDYVKAINDGLPAGLRNAAKAYRIANYGYETEGGNNQIPIAPPTSWNVFAQGIGLQSSARAEQTERSFAFKTNQQLLERRQQMLRDEMYRAYDQGDYAKLGKMLQSSIDFAIQHPEFHVNLQSGLQERAQARSIGAASGTGILTNKRLYPELANYQF